MKLIRNTIISTIFIIICILFIFIPTELDTRDSMMIQSNLFNIFRIIFILLAGIFVILESMVTKKSIVELFCITTIFILKYLFYDEIDPGIVMIIVSIFLFYSIWCNDLISFHFIEKFINLLFYFLVIYSILGMVFNYKQSGIIKLEFINKDVNYTAYFGFVLANYFMKIKKKRKGIFLFSLFLLTFSRLYIISLMIYILIFKFKIEIKRYTMIYLFSHVVLVIFGIIYIVLYDRVKPEYVYLTGFSRLKNLFDESNYIRFTANTLIFQISTIKDFILGFKKNTFDGLYLFRNKSINPHNLFFGLYVQFGAIVSGIYTSKYIKIFNKYTTEFSKYYIPIIFYHCILGVSSYYGMDLIFQLILIKIIMEKNKNGTNKDWCTDTYRACSSWIRNSKSIDEFICWKR